MSCDKSPHRIKNIFNQIAPYYDKMNDLMSLGTHFLIKTMSVKLLNLKENSSVLDLCCGSGDFTKIISKLHHKAKVIGLDNSVEMLKLAKIKNPNGSFILGDCLNLPFKEKEFGIVTVGFGLRNIENRTKAIQEAYRVLKVGGKFLHLDFGKHNFATKIFDVIVQFLVKIFNVHEKAYSYLIQSKKNYPEPKELIKEFEKEGFKLVECKNFMFGVISAQVYEK